MFCKVCEYFSHISKLCCCNFKLKRQNSNVKKANGKIVLTLNGWTTSKWISSVLIVASARWRMIYHCTLCVETTWSFTWIDTSLIYTGSIGWTLWIDSTFRTAVGWRSKVWRQTWARWTFVDYFALCIGSAWWWDAWILWLFRQFLTNWITSWKWITRKSKATSTDWVVVYHVTFWKWNIETDEFSI